MKTSTKKKNNFKKALGITALCLGLNGVIAAQCNASFTYTTSSSSISATSTSTGTTSSTNYGWSLHFLSGSSIIIGSSTSTSSWGNLYNGSYIVSLSIDSASGTGGTCTSTQTITISGGTNAPACNTSFTYTLGSSGLITCTNTSPVDSLGNTVYSCSFGGNFNYANTNTYNYYYNGTYTVTLLAYNNVDGCYATSSQTVTITNAHPAVPCTSAFTYTLGATGQANFTNSYTGTAPTVSYYWSFGDGGSSNVQNPTYTYPYNGTYIVSLSVADSLNNCYNTSSDTIIITNTANPPCAPTVSFYLTDSASSTGTSLPPHTFDAYPTYSSQVTSATWHWGDGTSTAGLYPSHTYSAAGEYSICVTVYAACGDSSTTCQNDSVYRLAHQNNVTNSSTIYINVINTAATGIKINNEAAAHVSLYPNPSNGLFTLQLNNISANASKAQISISNILGEVIYASQEQINNNGLSKEIDLQNIANGSYFMKVSVGDRTYTNKTIISK